MKISTRGRYALRFMIDLGQNSGDKYIALKDISARQNISIKYLEQITILLSKSGLLTSVRGPQGGYKLAKAPKDYTIGEILRATEGNLSPVTCLETAENLCTLKDQCHTLSLWKGLDDAINNYLDSKSLQDLLNNPVGIKELKNDKSN